MMNTVSNKMVIKNGNCHSKDKGQEKTADQGTEVDLVVCNEKYRIYVLGSL